MSMENPVGLKDKLSYTTNGNLADAKDSKVYTGQSQIGALRKICRYTRGRKIRMAQRSKDYPLMEIRCICQSSLIYPLNRNLAGSRDLRIYLSIANPVVLMDRLINQLIM